MAAEANMRDVVQRLRAENSQALLELLEFGHVLDAFLQDLEHLATALQEIHTKTCNLFGSSDQENSAGFTLQEQVSRLNAWVSQFLAAFQQMHGAVHAWNIADARGHSQFADQRQTAGAESSVNGPLSIRKPQPILRGDSMNSDHTSQLLVGAVLHVLAVDTAAALGLASALEGGATAIASNAPPKVLREAAVRLKSTALELCQSAAHLVGAAERLRLVAELASDADADGNDLPS